MPARKVSNMYYDGSAARKILPQEDKKTQRKRKVNSAAKRRNSLKRQQEQRKKNAHMVAFILCGFTMATKKKECSYGCIYTLRIYYGHYSNN